MPLTEKEIEILRDDHRTEVSALNALVKLTEVTQLALETLAEGSATINTPQAFTVAAVPVTTWNAATGFTSDAIEFTSSRPWAIQVTNYNITPGTPVLTIEVSVDGVTYNDYKPQAVDIDITTEINRVIFDDSMPFKYLRVVYTSGGSTGDFSLQILK